MKLDNMTPEEVAAYASSASDEELNAYLKSHPLSMAIQANKEAQSKPASVDNTQGMSGPELFAAGMGQRMMGIPRGLKEIGIGMFGTPERIKEYNQEKSDQSSIDKALLSNWEAGAGGLGSDVITSALGGAKVLPQVLLAGAGAAVRPTAGPIQGPETLERLVNSGAAAGTTALTGSMIQLAGKGAGAVGRQYSPEGESAMRLNSAANRLGIDRKIGDLDPSSTTSALERNLPGYPGIVKDQSLAFTRAAQDIKDIPSKTGKSFEPRLLEGEKLREAIVEGGKALETRGSQLWQELDNHVLNAGLPGVKLLNTAPTVSRVVAQLTPVNKRGVSVLEKNPIYQRIDEFDPDSAKRLMALQSPKTLLSFDELHKLQTAVGTALRRAEKDAAVPGSSMGDRKARTELRNLYSNLSADVDAWAVKDKSAQSLLSDAKSFWRDKVVPGTVNNKVYQRSNQGVYGATPRAYTDPAQLYSDVNRHTQNLQDIYPYMSTTGQDLFSTLNTLPDVSRHLTTGQLPTPPMGPLTAMAGVVAGSPFQGVRAALAHIPGTRSLLGSEGAKRLYFAKDVLEGSPAGRLVWGASQGVQQPLESGTKRVLGLKPRP